MDHFYVFYIDNKGNNCYERTCGCETAAKNSADRLNKLYLNAFYTRNELPKKWFY